MRSLLALSALLYAAVAVAQEPPRDVHSHAQPDKVVIRDIGLDLKVDFEAKQLQGRADLALEWIDPAARELVLDTRDLTIERVSGKGEDGRWFKLEHALGETDPHLGQKLTITLRRPYENVRIRYRTSPQASGLQWLEPSMTAGKRHPFMFSQSQAVHARSWVPLQDTPSVRYTYSARVRTDASLMALMSADNPPDEPRDGDYVFRMRQPIPSYLMAIAVGDVVFKPISERSGIWAEPATLEAAHAEFIDTEAMIAATEALYGPYRWERYDLLVLPPSFPYGGMENPRLSFITPTVIVGDKSLVSLIAHELAHSWSGNLVTNARWADMWLNEGFTSYVENRIIEALYGEDVAAMERVINQDSLRREIKRMPKAAQVLAPSPVAGSDPEGTLSSVAYDKGAWFLGFLESRVGRETFDAFLRGYFEHFAFQSIETGQFLAYLRENLLQQFPQAITDKELDAWLYQPGIPANAPAAVSTRLEAVDEVRKRWLGGQVPAEEIDTRGWVSQEWVHFLEGLPNKLSNEQLVELDEAFRLTTSHNGEILMRWFPLTVRSGYFEARPAIAEFLQTNGRRKLIMPVYEALVASRDGREFARQVFEQARPGYHPITTASVEAVVAERKR
ncbi:M1 family metallopeptidase [Denitratimonas sp. CY0512]|uniref:M1 family metallopeptidase n=1 Tax=Denitratimonas sp. CY0512 TaxID=3131940 RepID=UPI0030B714CC